MGEVNYYLKKSGKSNNHLIYLQFRYHGQKLVFSFNETIDPKNWNYNKHRVKNNTKTTSNGKFSLNDLLDNLSEVCQQAYNKEVKNGIPHKATIKKYLKNFIDKNIHEDANTPTLFSLIERFCLGEIKSMGRKVGNATKRNYKACEKHLKDFEKVIKYKISFDTINLDFFYKYTTFLEEEVMLEPNTIAKDIKTLKRFMGEAVDLGYTDNLAYKRNKFRYSMTETDAVYLTDVEISELYKHDFSHNKRLERVRDLFVVGTHVGLRFSDLSQIKAENIIVKEGRKLISIIPKKTKSSVVIPCHPVVLEILNKYTDEQTILPKAIEIVNFNKYIKEACKIAGFVEKGRLVTNSEKELWQCVTSHTCRRSFATNSFLSGIKTIDIMKITGHKTESSFMKYIKTDKLETAMRIGAHFDEKYKESNTL